MTDIQQRLPLKFQTERCSRQSYDIQIADEQTAVPIDWRSPGTATPEQATPEQASLELGPLELDPLELGTSGAGARPSTLSNSDSIDWEYLRDVVGQILADTGFLTATISIAVVDNLTIHKLNRQYLDHDWPTDVLSFPLEKGENHLEGEVVVSADTAKYQANQHDWRTVDELVLYIIHGILHLVGYRDKQPEEIALMRAAEIKYLRCAKVPVQAGDTRWHGLTQPGDNQVL